MRLAPLVVALVPESSDPAAPRIDVPGLLLSAAGLATLVFTIIEAPGEGWGSARTLLGFAAAAGLFAAFVRHERRTAQPTLDLRLFADPPLHRGRPGHHGGVLRPVRVHLRRAGRRRR